MARRKLVIPQMQSKSEQLEAAGRADKIRMLIRGERWSFDETLRAFSAVVFYSGPRRRERAINWLEELLEDLKRPGSAFDEVDAWKESRGSL